MESSNADSNRETLNLLMEVRDFIARLPKAPITRDMLVKIDEHIEDPTRRLALSTPATRTGGSYTPAGVGLVKAILKGDELTLSIPEAGSAVRDAKILSSMRKGLTLKMKPD